MSRAGGQIFALGCVLALAQDAGAQPQDALNVASRAPIVVVSSILDGTDVTSSAVLRAVASAVESTTNLEVLAPERAGLDLSVIDTCQAGRKVGCWAESLREMSRGEPPLLLVVGVQPAKVGGVRLLSLLIDVNRGSDGPSTQPLARVEPAVLPDSDPDALKAYFARAIDQVFVEVLRERGNYGVFGTIEVRCDLGEAQVTVDDRWVGTLKAGTMRLTQVPRGERSVTLASARTGAKVSKVVRVVSGKTSLVSYELARTSTFETAVLWGGVGVAALGTALSIFAVASPSRSEVYELCAGCERAPPTRGFATWCERTSSDPACHDSGGVLALPLGYSLVATGVTTALMTRWIEDEGWRRWLPIVAGLVVGATSYGLSVAVNPGR